MSEGDREKWDRIYSQSDSEVKEPNWFTTWLPGPTVGPRALDVACGRGGATFSLCRKGYSLTCLDISTMGLNALETSALSHGYQVDLRQVDLEGSLPALPSFAVIHCAHYLDYALFQKLALRLLPGGRILTEHHGHQNLERHAHPSARFLVNPSRLAESLDNLEMLSQTEGWHDARYLCRGVWERSER